MDGFFRPALVGSRITGPVVVTYSHHDEVLGIAYALASRLADQPDSAIGPLGGPHDEFGALGANGALATPESVWAPMGALGGQAYASPRERSTTWSQHLHSQLIRRSRVPRSGWRFWGRSTRTRSGLRRADGGLGRGRPGTSRASSVVRVPVDAARARRWPVGGRAMAGIVTQPSLRPRSAAATLEPCRRVASWSSRASRCSISPGRWRSSSGRLPVRSGTAPLPDRSRGARPRTRDRDQRAGRRAAGDHGRRRDAAGRHAGGRRRIWSPPGDAGSGVLRLGPGHGRPRPARDLGLFRGVSAGRRRAARRPPRRHALEQLRGTGPVLSRGARRSRSDLRPLRSGVDLGGHHRRAGPRDGARRGRPRRGGRAADRQAARGVRAAIRRTGAVQHAAGGAAAGPGQSARGAGVDRRPPGRGPEPAGPGAAGGVE